MDLCFDQSQNRFNVRVAAIILNDKNQLLVMNDNFATYPYLVGGRIKWGETSREALARECFEELHQTVTIGNCACVMENFFVEPTLHKTYHEICYFYFVNLTEKVSDGSFYYTDFDDQQVKPQLILQLLKENKLNESTCLHLINRD